MPTGHYPRKQRVTRLVFACEMCRNEIKIKPGEFRARGKPRFCSHKCQGEYNKRPGTFKEFLCNYCGKPSRKKTYFWAAKNYCSRTCSGAAKRVDGARWRDPVKIKDYMRKYTLKNRLRLNAQKNEWKKNNRHIVNAIQRARRAGAKYGDFLPHEWDEIKNRYGRECLACGQREPEIKLEPDHIQALAKGGAHKADNIQPLCRSCNARKGAKFIDFRAQSASKHSTAFRSTS